jgi:hypothetical protein
VVSFLSNVCGGVSLARGKTAVVVLGKRLLPDGRAAPDLIGRVKKGAAVYWQEVAERKRLRAHAMKDKGKAKEDKGEDEERKDDSDDEGEDQVLLIVTGGATAVENKDTEAVVMKRLLVEMVLPPPTCTKGGTADR